jgi:hypothetical protein
MQNIWSIKIETAQQRYKHMANDEMLTAAVLLQDFGKRKNTINSTSDRWL